MEKIEFNDLLNHADKWGNDASSIKNFALKQVSRGRFEIMDTKVITKVKYFDEVIEVIFTNKLNIEEFSRQLYIATNTNFEPSLNFIYNKISLYDSSLVQALMKYKEKNYVIGSILSDEIWFKLYSKDKLNNKLRKIYCAEWIDYEKQLETGDVIYDEQNLCGLWAMPKELLLHCFNEECMERYGKYLFILKPISDCYYLNDGKEIIGDRYKVIDKFSLYKIQDIGRLILYLKQTDEDLSKKIFEKLELEKNSLYQEKMEMYERFICANISIIKLKFHRWIWLLLGMLLGVFLQGLYH